MTVINTNVKSLIAQASLTANNKNLSTAMERLSTGSRINSAKDDAAGLAISSRMSSQIRGLNMAVRNANDAISMVQTAEGSMDEISNMLQRMRELAVQAASDVNNSSDRANLDAEVQQLKTEIDRIVDTTRFNDKKLLDGSLNASIQIGAKAGETMNVNISNVSSLGLGSITGVGTEGVTSASISGVEATPTVARMSFSENGDYAFTLNVESAGGTSLSFDIEGSVTSGSADEIMDAINDKLLAASDDSDGSVAVPASLRDTIQVSVSGKTLTIENVGGGDIGVSDFVGATTSFTSVSGTDGSDNLILKTAAADSVTSFDVSGVSVTDRQPSVATVTPDVSGGVADDDELVLTLVANGVTTILSTDALEAADYAGDATSDATALVSALKAHANYAYSGYLITDKADGTFEIEREDGASFQIDANYLDDTGASIDLDTIANSIEVNSNNLLALSPETIDAGDLTVDGDDAEVQPNAVALNLVGLDTLEENDVIRLVMTHNGSTEVFSYTVAADAPSIDDIVLGLRDAADSSENYEFFKDANDQIVVKNRNGDNFTIDAAVVDADDATTAANLKIKVPTGIDIVAGVTPYAVNSQSAPKSMYIDFSGPDTYSLAFDNLEVGGVNDAISFNYTGTASNLLTIAAQMQADLDTLAEGAEGAPFDFVVSVEDGGIRIDELNGYAFGLSSFTSESNGTAIVRSGYGQESDSGLSMAVLDDTERANAASTLGEGLASATAVDLVFDALSSDQDSDDTYSFTISDGLRSARITNVTREGVDGDSVMLSAINSALVLSGMDDVMTAEATTDVDGGITLRHTLGRTISITDFTSTSDTAVSVRGGTTGEVLSTGIARYLDDNYDSANGSVVRDIDVTTASRAQDAIDVLDYAINDVATERANLGAIQNRLNHTINNLTNISVNTEASRSRIMDADYGQESANLAKAQIIQQAATAMLAQANQQPQSVLSLLQ